MAKKQQNSSEMPSGMTLIITEPCRINGVAFEVGETVGYLTAPPLSPMQLDPGAIQLGPRAVQAGASVHQINARFGVTIGLGN